MSKGVLIGGFWLRATSGSLVVAGGWGCAPILFGLRCVPALEPAGCWVGLGLMIVLRELMLMHIP